MTVLKFSLNRLRNVISIMKAIWQEGHAQAGRENQKTKSSPPSLPTGNRLVPSLIFQTGLLSSLEGDSEKESHVQHLFAYANSFS